MLNTLWLLVVKNWKTTVTGIVIALVWLAGLVGINIPDEVKQTLTAFLISLGLLFSKDGNKTGLQ